MFAAIVFLVVLVGAVSAALVLFSRRINNSWSKAGEELGLSAVAGSIAAKPTLEGTVESFPVEVAAIPEPVNGSTMTQTTVSFPSLGAGFRLEAADGDGAPSEDDFDGRFTIEADDPAAVTSTLSPNRRAALVRLADTYPSLTATNTELSAVTPGTVTRPETIVTTVHDLVATAHELTVS